MQSTQQHFPPDPSALREVRIFARTTLAQWDLEILEWSVVQALTELATNAVLHARTAFVVSFAFDGKTVTVRVSDGAARGAMIRPATLLSTTGRGLSLVDNLSERWGVDADINGKSVWCVFSTDSADRNFELESDEAEFIAASWMNEGDWDIAPARPKASAA